MRQDISLTDQWEKVDENLGIFVSGFCILDSVQVFNDRDHLLANGSTSSILVGQGLRLSGSTRVSTL